MANSLTACQWAAELRRTGSVTYAGAVRCTSAGWHFGPEITITCWCGEGTIVACATWPASCGLPPERRGLLGPLVLRHCCACSVYAQRPSKTRRGRARARCS